MNLRDFEYVTAVDRHRNFGKAAQASNVSQPALSAQIKKLEAELGVEIFVRSSQAVATTDAGRRIVESAHRLLRTAQQISDCAAEYHDPMAAPLKIGIFPTLAASIIPYLIETVEKLAPGLKLIFREVSTDNLLREMDDRTIDVAMLSGPIEKPGYNFTSVFCEGLHLAVSAQHKLANRNRIAAEEVPAEELLLMCREHCLRDEILNLFGKERTGIDVAQDLRAMSLDTAAIYVARDYGCTLIPALALPRLTASHSDIRMLEIEGAECHRTIGFMSRVGCPREHILFALCDAMKAHLPAGAGPLCDKDSQEIERIELATEAA